MYDFKKYFIWCSWLTVNLFVSWYFCIFAIVGFDYLIFDLTGSYYLNILNELNIFACHVVVFKCFPEIGHKVGTYHLAEHFINETY